MFQEPVYIVCIPRLICFQSEEQFEGGNLFFCDKKKRFYKYFRDPSQKFANFSQHFRQVCGNCVLHVQTTVLVFLKIFFKRERKSVENVNAVEKYRVKNFCVERNSLLPFFENCSANQQISPYV